MKMLSLAAPLVAYAVNQVGDFVKDEIVFQLKVQEKINFLREEMQAIKAFLRDVDSMEKQDERARNWAREARDLAYEAEDIMDCVELKLDEKRYPSLQLKNRRSIAIKIDQLSDRLREIAGRKVVCGISSIGEVKKKGYCDPSLQMWRRTFPGLQDKHQIVGLVEDKISILRRLQDKEARLIVIPIVGMGGIGKTTLATIVFNEASKSSPSDSNNQIANGSIDHCSESVMSVGFSFSVWLSVTQHYTVEELLRRLIKEFVNKKDTHIDDEKKNKQKQSSSSEEDDEADEGYAELAMKLSGLLRNERYLIVLDDVWSTEVWHLMVRALPDNNNGSSVLLTTRSAEVANHACGFSSVPHELKPLTEDKSLKLFLDIVFPTTPHECPSELKQLADQLSRKCLGVPLVLVVLGRLMSAKAKNPGAWQGFTERMSWVSSEAGKQCLRILALSYQDLPYHIKFCFLYFGAFPQGFEIYVSKLIRLWIADGLVQAQGDWTMEETAQHYLDELINRSLVQVVRRRSSDDGAKVVRIHDFLHRLSILEALETQFLQVDGNAVHSSSSISNRLRGKKLGARRLSLHSVTSHLPLNSKKLRALLTFSAENEVGSFGKCLKYLRVLELEGLKLEDSAVKELGDLVHLKYLSLKGTNLSQLPSSVAKLHGLQTLDIRLTKIRDLPRYFWDLSHLRHLYLNSVTPTTIESCKSQLHTLKQANSGKWLRDLPSMKQLRKLGLEGVTPLYEEISLPELLGQVDLTSLTLRGGQFSSRIIEAMKSNCHLHRLKLEGKFDSELPSEFPTYLTKLVLVSSKLKEDPMKVLEKLPSLRALTMKDAYDGENMSCSVGGFPALRQLEFNMLLKLNKWSTAEESLPNLVSLSVSFCTRLKELPNALRRTQSLKEVTLHAMKGDFIEQIERDWDDWHVDQPRNLRHKIFKLSRTRSC